MVRPLAYIHGRRQGESSTNKYGKYKGSVRILTKPKPQYTQITQYRRDIVILQLQQQQSCSPKI